METTGLLQVLNNINMYTRGDENRTPGDGDKRCDRRLVDVSISY